MESIVKMHAMDLHCKLVSLARRRAPDIAIVSNARNGQASHEPQANLIVRVGLNVGLLAASSKRKPKAIVLRLVKNTNTIADKPNRSNLPNYLIQQ